MKGVDIRINEINDLGYDAYHDKKDGLNRVGVRFEYQQKDEINRVLNRMRNEFDRHAWILSE